MIKCKNCSKFYDESIAAGICPYCGCMETESFDNGNKNVVPHTVPLKNTSPQDLRGLPIGTILNNRYQVCEVIGDGGFGITYKVWDNKHSVYKAVKEYFQKNVVNRIPGETEVFISAPKQREEFEYGKMRLLEEARIVAKFQSKSIVKVDDYFEENNTSYMVMEYLELKTLGQYMLERKTVLEPAQAINIGVHICEALEEIHKAGVIHRDIAPDNILVSDDGEVKIIDFGSARLSKEDTDDRMIVFKPGFAPPEQYEKINLADDKQKGWTDVYALGATLYMTLTNVVPAESTDRKADFDNKTDRLCNPREINPNVPEFLSNTIMTAMAIHIHERFKDAGEFKAALLQERKVLPLAEVRKRKRRVRTAGIAGSLAVAVGIATFGMYWYSDKKADVILDEATISMWYSVSSDEVLKQQKISAMEAMKNEILSSDAFSEVTIELLAISEDEYLQKLETAYKDGNMPHLFESLDANATYMNQMEDLRDVVKNIEKESCYFISSYSDYFYDTNRIPIGFNIPVIYINTSLVSDYTEKLEISSISDLMQLCDGDMKYKPMAVDEDWALIYSKMFSDFSEYENLTETYTIEDFLQGKAAVYFSDTEDYYKVREGLPGSFAMEPIVLNSVICQFSDYWSISQCDGAEEVAAKEVLTYLFSNYFQDRYYLQTNMPGIPLERMAVAEYSAVRPKFAEVLSECSKYKFEKK